MPRKRSPENAGLPKRWRVDHGAYYYQVPPGLEELWDGKKSFRLGKSLPEAYRTWADRIGAMENAKTIGDLLDRYASEVVPAKAVTTQDGNQQAIKKLRAVFGMLPLSQMKPRLVYLFHDKAHAKVAAKRAIEVLSHAFTKAVEWGYMDSHPFKGEVRLPGEKSRDRYVEDWELIECLSLDSRRKLGSVLAIQAYIRIKMMTSMPRGDLLRLEPAVHFRDDGIFVQRHKTATSSGKRTIYEWTPELRAAVDIAKQYRPNKQSRFLFCNRDGESYLNEETGKASGWKSMWQRFFTRVLKETEVKVPFTEHDLRAKCASDAATLEHARALLAHADARITAKVYRRKPERVTPLKPTV